MVRKMESKEQLLDMLNRMKRDEMKEVGAKASYPFMMQKLTFYCNPNHPHRYKQFRIRKKSGGIRQISAPKTRSFKLLLRYVNKMLAAVYTPSDYAMGFTERRSVVTNADVHKGQNYVFNVDLKDFFPSIDQARVWKRLQLEPFCFDRSIANILAGLCAMKQKMDDGSVRFVLPQGAPTSPIITNMICDTLDRRLAGLAKRFGLRYSRYADDITFSSMHNVYQEAGDFRKELKRIIEGQGFSMNEAKTRLQKLGSRQEVTGVIISRKLNVTQEYVREIRNILYIWDRYGYDAAFNKFVPKYRKEKSPVKRRIWDMVNVLNGRLMYLKMVKGENDSVYVRLKTKFDLLVRRCKEAYYTSTNGVAYLETTPVLAFEKKNGTTVTIAMSDPKYPMHLWPQYLYDELVAMYEEYPYMEYQYVWAEFLARHTKTKERGDDNVLESEEDQRNNDELRQDSRVIGFQNMISGIEADLGFDATAPVLDTMEEEEADEIAELLVPRQYRYAHFMLAGKKRLASVHKSVSAEEEKQKERLAISRCRDAKGNCFWLVHHLTNVVATLGESADIDIEELNKDLDALLGNVYG